MIALTKSLNMPEALRAEYIKIKCLFESYSEDALFWIQDENQAYISMVDGNMIIYNCGGDTEELSEFVSVLNPACVFSDIETLKAIDRLPKEEIYVMHKTADEEKTEDGDTLTSDKLYELLNVDGLSLPDYPHFAVDICYRLNHKRAEYFALLNKCAAISFHTGNFAIMNGIASHQKGYGSVALKNILAKNYGREFLVCCRSKVKGFYEKNGFKEIYKSGYWVKNL